LKKLITDPTKCVGCGICENACANTWYKEKDKEKAAIRIYDDEQGGYKIAVCDQCGVCKEMCSMMSLKTAANGVVQLNKKTCVGCLICVAECLRGYMFYNDDLPTPFKCIACGVCAKECPNEALSISEGGK